MQLYLLIRREREFNNSCCISRFSFCLMCTHNIIFSSWILKGVHLCDKKVITFTLSLIMYNGHQLATNYLSCLVMYAAIYRSVTFKEDGIGFVVISTKAAYFIFEYLFLKLWWMMIKNHSNDLSKYMLLNRHKFQLNIINNFHLILKTIRL